MELLLCGRSEPLVAWLQGNGGLIWAAHAQHWANDRFPSYCLLYRLATQALHGDQLVHYSVHNQAFWRRMRDHVAP